ncbi:MAG: chemotaxis protein [Oscillatoria sp. SIO1A7]|nr:chemotaxis protein [Oscillatoria sp. SIO1A7]
MKTTAQLVVAAVAIFASSAINVISVYSLLDRLTDDARVVNHAGIVRGATQRLVKLELGGEQGSDLIEKLDLLVNSLINGNEDLGLPPATDPEFLAKMQDVEAAWQKLKQTIKANRVKENDTERLIRESEKYFELTNEAVFAAEDFSKKEVKTLQAISLILFGFNTMVLLGIGWLIRSIQLKLKKTVSAIAISSTEIAAVIAQQEALASKQALTVRETTTTMEELRGFSQQSVEYATTVAEGASQVRNLSQDGTNAVEQTLFDMAKLQAKVIEMQKPIMHLSEQTSQISRISGLVGNLANQTNMLALNAAVEANRAKEHGKGFAVVASEIRQLADRSKKSAEKIKDLVADIQGAINSTVLVTDESTKTVSSGVETTQGMIAAFQEVAGAIEELFASSEQISLSANQQATAIQQAIDAMSDLNRAAQETAGGIRQTKSGMEDLTQIAIGLDDMV